MNTAKDGADRFVEVFRVAALQAGSLARRLQAEAGVRAKLGERSPEAAALTSVDLAAQDVILLLLHVVFPDVGMDAEEDTDTLRLFRPESSGRPTIVVDPVDGTLNYAEGLPDYAVMGAWVEEGFYRAALVHFPAAGETYWARRGGRCRALKEGARAREVRVAAQPAKVLVSGSLPEGCAEALGRAGFDVAASRCSAVDATAPATGRAAAAVSPGKPDRRRSIGFLIALEAGGAVWMCGRWWNGEDPRSMPGCRGPTVVAGDRETAGRVIEAVSGCRPGRAPDPPPEKGR